MIRAFKSAYRPLWYLFDASGEKILLISTELPNGVPEGLEGCFWVEGLA